MATYNQGYTYDMGKRIGYDISVPIRTGRLLLSHVSYHSKGRVIAHLIHDGYQKEDIEVVRVDKEETTWW